MQAIMTTTQFETLNQIEDFLSGTQEGAFLMPTKAARYAFIQTTLIRFKLAAAAEELSTITSYGSQGIAR